MSTRVTDPLAANIVTIHGEISEDAFGAQMDAALKAAQDAVEQTEILVRTSVEGAVNQTQIVTKAIAEALEKTRLAAQPLAQESGDRGSAAGKVSDALGRVSNALLQRELDAMAKELDKPAAEIAIEMPPGTRMMNWACALFSKRTIELVFEPIVADYQHEVFEALQAGHPQAEVKLIRARHWTGFLLAVACQIAGSIGKLVRALKGAG